MLKLYVWRNLESLYECTEGVAFALAESVEQARALFRVRLEDTAWGEDGEIYEHPVIAEMAHTEPTVYDTPMCDWQQGAG